MLILFLLALMLMGCCKTEILNAPPIFENVPDTSVNILKSEVDTTKKDDIRIPIGFNVSVEEWNEKESEL